MEKILYNNIIPYQNLTTGYYDFKLFNFENLSGSIIKMKEATTTANLSPTYVDHVILNKDNNEVVSTIEFKYIIDEFINNVLNLNKNNLFGVWDDPNKNTDMKDVNGMIRQKELINCGNLISSCKDEEMFNVVFYWYYYDEFKTNTSKTSGSDYKNFANLFTTSYNGTMGKANAVLRHSGCSANIIEFYILVKLDNFNLAKANSQFKYEFQDYMNDKKMLTDYISLKDGEIIYVDIAINVVLDKYYKILYICNG
jgi:hypothetical protein